MVFDGQCRSYHYIAMHTAHPFTHTATKPKRTLWNNGNDAWITGLAMENDVSNESDCRGNSYSFEEGCPSILRPLIAIPNPMTTATKFPTEVGRLQLLHRTYWSNGFSAKNFHPRRNYPLASEKDPCFHGEPAKTVPQLHVGDEAQPSKCPQSGGKRNDGFWASMASKRTFGQRTRLQLCAQSSVIAADFAIARKQT